jgi:hypothetical protein
VARNVREHAELARRERAVWDCDPQHRRQALDVQAIAEPQVQKVSVRETAVDVPLRLVAKLGDAFVDKVLIEFVVSVHRERAEFGVAANVSNKPGVAKLINVSMDRTD